ncbi:hypothetical protein PJG4_039 [Pseudomonas phage JG004]|uniref:Uncharacterized protein n=1 Tax=Pseudomonas phage JG004 TaxID=757342 RepID=F4YDF5_9CAUD|nr:hypothetical protein PJG4_039 [Pseudomonas phage JG004]ADF58237.1 hypothetical protein PJG4_039 [Pseudomonas phage JG004]
MTSSVAPMATSRRRTSPATAIISPANDALSCWTRRRRLPNGHQQAEGGLLGMNSVWVIFGQLWDDYSGEFDLHMLGVLGNTKAETIRRVVSSYPGLPAPDEELLDCIVAGLIVNAECEVDIPCGKTGKDEWVMYSIRKKEVYQ